MSSATRRWVWVGSVRSEKAGAVGSDNTRQVLRQRVASSASEAARCAVARGRGAGVQRQDLVQRRLERDEADADELVAGVGEAVAVQRQARGERRVGVVAQALRVGHGHQEQVQRPGLGRARLEPAFTHQAVVHPAELLGGPAQTLRTQQSFVHHLGLLA